MKNDLIRRIAEHRTHLEKRIIALGGTVPEPWPWDYDTSARNLQLIEVIEDLERVRDQHISVAACTPN